MTLPLTKVWQCDANGSPASFCTIRIGDVWFSHVVTSVRFQVHIFLMQ
jgi:hypothetical protein